MDVSVNRRDLFPSIEPYERGMLELDGRHHMYWEQSGNPAGVPVVFLHGGPGAGVSPIHRRFFEPHHYRIVCFDQRGAGRSRPFADLTDNTTPHLIDDIERLRHHLGIGQWLVFGGSWGAALALAYGLAHPTRCLGFVLRGVFLARRGELDWFLNGMKTIFPEAWRAFIEFLPEAERHAPLESFYTRLTDSDPEIHMPAARAWSRYENSCSNLVPQTGGGNGNAALALARIEAHYFKHRMFFEDGIPLEDIAVLRDKPCFIVQGRYDVVCPIISADELARAWPEADYAIVPDAGHSALEPGIRAALIEATENFRGLNKDQSFDL
ncbi:MAG: prolyl aminopeptidase [Rhodospirillales bacterium]